MPESKSNVPVEQQQVIDDIVKKINKLKPEQQALLETLTPDELENVAAWVNGFKAGCERNDRQAKSEAKKPCRRFFLIRNVGRQRRTCQA